jgi:uncharacterized protein (DUF1330 family)
MTLGLGRAYRTEHYVPMNGVLNLSTRSNGAPVISFGLDMAALDSWYQSSDYAPLIALRQAAAYCDVVAFEGI